MLILSNIPNEKIQSKVLESRIPLASLLIFLEAYAQVTFPSEMCPLNDHFNKPEIISKFPVLTMIKSKDFLTDI